MPQHLGLFVQRTAGFWRCHEILTFDYAMICNVCADSGDFEWDLKLQECMMRGSIATSMSIAIHGS